MKTRGLSDVSFQRRTAQHSATVIFKKLVVSTSYLHLVKILQKLPRTFLIEGPRMVNILGLPQPNTTFVFSFHLIFIARSFENLIAFLHPPAPVRIQRVAYLFSGHWRTAFCLVRLNRTESIVLGNLPNIQDFIPKFRHCFVGYLRKNTNSDISERFLNKLAQILSQKDTLPASIYRMTNYITKPGESNPSILL